MGRHGRADLHLASFRQRWHIVVLSRGPGCAWRPGPGLELRKRPPAGGGSRSLIKQAGRGADLYGNLVVKDDQRSRVGSVGPPPARPGNTGIGREVALWGLLFSRWLARRSEGR